MGWMWWLRRSGVCLAVVASGAAVTLAFARDTRPAKVRAAAAQSYGAGLNAVDARATPELPSKVSVSPSEIVPVDWACTCTVRFGHEIRREGRMIGAVEFGVQNGARF